ncbi:MAG: M23 family metallopeptidase [Patescibacteria group bacterium]
MRFWREACYIIGIKTIIHHIKPLFRGYPLTTSPWSLLFILGLLILNGLFLLKTRAEIPYKNIGWSSGGPVFSGEEGGGTLSGSLVYSLESSEGDGQLKLLDGTVLLAYSEPISNLIPARDGLNKYKIQVGDTLSSIAANFGISLETIRLANPNTRSSIRVGEELIILPTTGILYETKDGDSLELVANRYQVSSRLIQDQNPNYQKLFASPGNKIILPNAKPLSGAEYANRYVRGLPDLGNYFALPARGWNWGELHDYNAVDIADQCGRPVYASAEGLVKEESSNGYWNRGYGNAVLIEHPNGTETRYVHLAKSLVRVGDYVSQGDEIALIGNTGNTHGPTGCHLHFEIYGAKNPFAVR